MQLVLLGIGVGLLSVCVPGPVSLSLVQVATAQGRASGTRAAAGIVGGDVILSILAIGVVTAGAALPDAGFAAMQQLSAAVLVTLGVVMISRPLAVRGRAASVSRPFRAFLALTTLLPSAFGSWLALLTAMPFATSRSSLTTFAMGVVAISLVWHLLLGYSAGRLGPRLTQTVIVRATRLGGAATISLGVWALL